MRNDVNKRPKRPGDLAAILAATPPADSEFLQGVVVTMVLATGANSVSLAGGIVQTNCVVVGDPALIPAGTQVFIVRARRRYFILGPMNGQNPSSEVFRFSQRLLITTPGVGSFDPDTYPGLRGIQVSCIGGGGAGGGTPLTAATNRAAGGGGGAGGTDMVFLPKAAISNPTSYTVGAGGTGVSGGTGNTGGATFFDSGVCLGNGGVGGVSMAVTTGLGAAKGGAGGTAFYNFGPRGGPGTPGIASHTATAYQIGGTGGSTAWGGGGHANTAVSGVGTAGTAMGGGGAGSQAGGAVVAAQAGGAGGAGGIIIDIYV